MTQSLWFRERCRKNGLEITDAQLAAFEELAARLLDWNAKINLISRTDEENLWNRHLLGSISFLFGSSLPESFTMADVGTGGGFPGLPLAILFPQARFTLIDSIQKKMLVVDDLIRALKLPNAAVRAGRAEDLSASEEYRGTFDFVVARAVAPAKDLIKWTRPFLRKRENAPPADDRPRGTRLALPPGVLLLLKGGDLTREIEESLVKAKPRWIRSYPIIVDGADPADPVDKKLVIVQP